MIDEVFHSNLPETSRDTTIFLATVVTHLQGKYGDALVRLAEHEGEIQVGLRTLEQLLHLNSRKIQLAYEQSKRDFPEYNTSNSKDYDPNELDHLLPRDEEMLFKCSGIATVLQLPFINPYDSLMEIARAASTELSHRIFRDTEIKLPKIIGFDKDFTQHVPAVVTVEYGGIHRNVFSVNVPHPQQLEGTMRVFVTNPSINAEYTAFVFENKELLKFYLASVITTIQEKTAQEFVQKLEQVSQGQLQEMPRIRRISVSQRPNSYSYAELPPYMAVPSVRLHSRN